MRFDSFQITDQTTGYRLSFNQFIKGVGYRGQDSNKTFHVYTQPVKNGCNVCETLLTSPGQNITQCSCKINLCRLSKTHSNAWYIV